MLPKLMSCTGVDAGARKARHRGMQLVARLDEEGKRIAKAAHVQVLLILQDFSGACCPFYGPVTTKHPAGQIMDISSFYPALTTSEDKSG